MKSIKQAKVSLQDKIADIITSFAGSMPFVYIHTILFAAWISTSGFGRDSFPFNFLTMTVSLEAIYLSTFVMISQNKQAAISENNNKRFQRVMLTDEKVDLKNETLIKELLSKIDIEHLSPMKKQLEELHQEFVNKDILVTKIIKNKYERKSQN